MTARLDREVEQKVLPAMWRAREDGALMGRINRLANRQFELYLAASWRGSGGLNDAGRAELRAVKDELERLWGERRRQLAGGRAMQWEELYR